MQAAGMTIIFNERGVVVQKGVGICKTENIDRAFNVTKVNYSLWHQRLGHIGKQKFIELKNKQMIYDLDQICNINPSDDLCEACIKDFVAKSEAHFDLKVVNLYSDNGGEYLSNEMKDYCCEKGITYHLTVPRTPQLNGVSERMVRTITEKARSMIISACMDKIFWGDAVLTATYLINITPTGALK
ncbi:unnamed protein product [Hermetia illucens]|uniref:Integrase catalytic domain-containing protein n=1 Tax=Hermetia illucens TaxID=343691 RepID=A0A7R8UJL2_HERIL|nr:unnamed protein product [Hermetia illucens]